MNHKDAAKLLAQVVPLMREPQTWGETKRVGSSGPFSWIIDPGAVTVSYCRRGSVGGRDVDRCRTHEDVTTALRWKMPLTTMSVDAAIAAVRLAVSRLYDGPQLAPPAQATPQPRVAFCTHAGCSDVRTVGLLCEGHARRAETYERERQAEAKAEAAARARAALDRAVRRAQPTAGIVYSVDADGYAWMKLEADADLQAFTEEGRVSVPEWKSLKAKTLKAKTCSTTGCNKSRYVPAGASYWPNVGSWCATHINEAEQVALKSGVKSDMSWSVQSDSGKKAIAIRERLDRELAEKAEKAAGLKCETPNCSGTWEASWYHGPNEFRKSQRCRICFDEICLAAGHANGDLVDADSSVVRAFDEQRRIKAGMLAPVTSGGGAGGGVIVVVKPQRTMLRPPELILADSITWIEP